MYPVHFDLKRLAVDAIWCVACWLMFAVVLVTISVVVSVVALWNR